MKAASAPGALPVRGCGHGAPPHAVPMSPAASPSPASGETIASAVGGCPAAAEPGVVSTEISAEVDGSRVSSAGVRLGFESSGGNRLGSRSGTDSHLIDGQDWTTRAVEPGRMAQDDRDKTNSSLANCNPTRSHAGSREAARPTTRSDRTARQRWLRTLRRPRLCRRRGPRAGARAGHRRWTSRGAPTRRQRRALVRGPPG